MSKVGQVSLRFLVFLGLYTAAHWFGWIEGPWFVAVIPALLVSLFVTFLNPRPHRASAGLTGSSRGLGRSN